MKPISIFGNVLNVVNCKRVSLIRDRAFNAVRPITPLMGEKLADCRDNALTKSSVLDFQNIGLQMLKVFVIGRALQSVEPLQIEKMIFDLFKGYILNASA